MHNSNSPSQVIQSVHSARIISNSSSTKVLYLGRSDWNIFLLNETRRDKANKLMRILMRIQKTSNQENSFFEGEGPSSVILLTESDPSSFIRGATSVRRRLSARRILRGIFQLKKLYGRVGGTEESLRTEFPECTSEE